ncbi:hypothetical protein [Lysobacter capsici]|uniref:hypothetical protein n=1 Tax=Lysobacter capsici TaxID=435897 RepID=UPI0011E05844|nr:hypothetical protein [Lysobacter capsici]
MNRISARMIVFYKWIAPATSLLILAVTSLQWSKSEGAWPWYFWVFLVAAAIVAAMHGVKMGRLADEVVDHGDYLRVRRGSIEESDSDRRHRKNIVEPRVSAGPGDIAAASARTLGLPRLVHCARELAGLLRRKRGGGRTQAAYRAEENP